MAGNSFRWVPLLLPAALCACGPGKPEIQSVSVDANVNNALSARVTVHASNVVNVAVRYALAGALTDAARRTPYTAATSDPLVLPVLGLAPQTAYELQVIATTETGAVLSSATFSFTSGSLPEGVPAFALADGGFATGYTLLSPVQVANDAGTWAPAVIVDGTGQVVWYYPVNGQLLDWQRQYDGTFTAGAGGVFEQINSLGDIIHTWRVQDGPTDLHEVRLLPGGNALLFGYDTETMDLTPYGGQPNTPVLATVMERVNSKGEVQFSWDPFDHASMSDIDPSIPLIPAVPAGETTTDVSVDWTHGNAIDVADDGNYLVSYRNLSTVFKIDSTTGDILWRLGGKESAFSFPDDPLGGPSMQHAVRELTGGHIIVFDNGNEHSPPQSRAVEYALDTSQNVATVAWSYEPQPPLFAAAMGFAQRLSDGTTLVNFGLVGRVQQVSPQGQVLWDLSSPMPIYRAMRIDSLY
jgi:hypothetical protein